MDPVRFDRLSRWIAGGQVNRRRVWSMLLGIVVPITHDPPLVSASCKQVGRKCDRNGDCCDGARCKSKTCRCKDNFTNCDDKCFNLDTDERQCGACDNVCADGERCCGGQCVNLDFNRDHCGACDAACPAPLGCENGTCALPPGGCEAGQSQCLTGEFVTCGGDPGCRCQQSVEGQTVCVGGAIPGVFCGCFASAECVAELGPGAVCVDGGDAEFCCGPDLPNVCRLPCASL